MEGENILSNEVKREALRKYERRMERLRKIALDIHKDFENRIHSANVQRLAFTDKEFLEKYTDAILIAWSSINELLRECDNDEEIDSLEIFRRYHGFKSA